MTFDFQDLPDEVTEHDQDKDEERHSNDDESYSQEREYEGFRIFLKISCHSVEPN